MPPPTHVFSHHMLKSSQLLNLEDYSSSTESWLLPGGQTLATRRAPSGLGEFQKGLEGEEGERPVGVCRV